MFQLGFVGVLPHPGFNEDHQSTPQGMIRKVNLCCQHHGRISHCMNQIMAAIDSPNYNNKHHLKIVGFGILSLSKTGCLLVIWPRLCPQMSQLDGSLHFHTRQPFSKFNLEIDQSQRLAPFDAHDKLDRRQCWRKNVKGMDIKQRMVYEFIGPTKIRACTIRGDNVVMWHDHHDPNISRQKKVFRIAIKTFDKLQQEQMIKHMTTCQKKTALQRSNLKNLWRHTYFTCQNSIWQK